MWQELRGIRLDEQREQSNSFISAQLLDRRLVLAGTRPHALISGQRKDEATPGGGHAAPRAFSAEVAQGAQEEVAPEKTQGKKTEVKTPFVAQILHPGFIGSGVRGLPKASLSEKVEDLKGRLHLVRQPGTHKFI